MNERTNEPAIQMVEQHKERKRVCIGARFFIQLKPNPGWPESLAVCIHDSSIGYTGCTL
jgi:hypothetical protein